MVNKVSLNVGKETIAIKLDGSDISEKILDSLPIVSVANKWGDEIYFSIPVESDESGKVETLEVGDVAYWPPGNAFCIFFGRTPASTDDRPRAASPVIVIGKISDDDINKLKGLGEGSEIEMVAS